MQNLPYSDNYQGGTVLARVQTHRLTQQRTQKRLHIIWIAAFQQTSKHSSAEERFFSVTHGAVELGYFQAGRKGRHGERRVERRKGGWEGMIELQPKSHTLDKDEPRMHHRFKCETSNCNFPKKASGKMVA